MTNGDAAAPAGKAAIEGAKGSATGADRLERWELRSDSSAVNSLIPSGGGRPCPPIDHLNSRRRPPLSKMCALSANDDAALLPPRD